VVIVPQPDEAASSLPVLRYVTFDTEIGRFLVARSDLGLRIVTFAKNLDAERALARETRGKRVMAVEDKIRLRMVVDSIRGYLAGDRAPLEHKVDLSDTTDFNRRVLDVVRSIPYGVLRTYKWVAGEVGAPRATRPVGQALSRNPLPIVIPCHRVVNSDGSLGGYSGGGPDMKRRLIEIETGQIDLALRGDERSERERIRFLLESEGGDGEVDKGRD
jgi:methylated-DNA-[protein]-cysteine S-methyltransferase